MLGEQLTLPVVVDPPLLAAVHTGDSPSTIEERRGSRVLLLLELNDELEARPIAIDWEPCTEWARGRWITAQPVECRLTTTGLTENLIAQIEHVMLIGCRTDGHDAIVTGPIANDVRGQDQQLLKRYSPDGFLARSASHARRVFAAELILRRRRPERRR